MVALIVGFCVCSMHAMCTALFKPPVALAAVHSETVVLLLVICC